MKRSVSCFSIATFGAAMLLYLPPAQAAPAGPGSPAAAQYEQEPWAVPPSAYSAAERRGFHDGIEGARKDAKNHRPPDVNNREEYENPPVSQQESDAYREGFERGYQVGVEHLMSGGVAPVAPVQAYGQESWANPPAGWQEAQRKGFQDGIKGARQDAKNGRTADVNNRDEFRHPDVPRREWRAYRQGFRQGYQTGIEHLMHRGYHSDHD
ncbi:MAG TPA: hypothetical protein VFT88_13565 [Acidobacteriaceae bacterium]|jgi:ribosome modulation factor|nr:hypothetical protein [Acidobacteriaceae bacterium]